MNSRKSLLFLLTLAGLVLANPGHALAREHSATSHADGRIIMKFSPILGINVGINIHIDHRQVGVLTKGHVFDRRLTAGNHYVEVFRNGTRHDAWRKMIHVRPGQTYGFVIKYSGDQVVLQPFDATR